jgi:uncharacterized protein (DUF3820 family)
MTDESLMPFGKYKGEKMAYVPSDYLLWLWNNGRSLGDVGQYIANNLDAIKADIAYQSKCKS